MRGANLVMRGLFLLLALGVPVLVLLRSPTTLAAGAYDLWRFEAWLSCLAGMLGLFVLTGFAIRGRALGVLIDERNRYSLSRLQMTLWTVLVLSTLYVVLMGNVIRGGPDNTVLAIDLDYNLVVLMGFSVASLVASPMALSLQADRPAAPQEVARAGAELQSMQKLEDTPGATGRLLKKADPRDARLADLIRGEDVASATTVDLPRLQMLLITILVIVVYGAAVGNELLVKEPVLRALLELKPTLTMLVLVSHVGYITGKLIPAPSAAPGSATDAAKALLVSQRAASLATELQHRLLRAAPNDPQNEWIRSGLALAQGMAAQAAKMPSAPGAKDGALDPIELARLEGGVQALESSWGRQPPPVAARTLIDAPKTEMVSEVQRLLRVRGHVDVLVTGMSDGATERAIDAELAKMQMDRKALHPRPFRFYEELAQLL